MNLLLGLFTKAILLIIKEMVKENIYCKKTNLKPFLAMMERDTSGLGDLGREMVLGS